MRDHLDKTNTHLATKPNYRTWWHHLVAWAATLITAFAGRRFRDLWTTIGDTIYAPADTELDLETTAHHTMLAHELAHRYDDLAHGWWYRISYILSWSWRAHWEYRGYGMALVGMYRAGGGVSKGWPKIFAEAVSGPTYLWAGNYEEALEALEAIKDALERGELSPQVYDPNDPRFERYIPD